MRYIKPFLIIGLSLYAVSVYGVEFEYSIIGTQKDLFTSAKEIAGIFASVGLGLSLIPTVYNVATNNNAKKWLVSWIVSLFVFFIAYNLFY